MVGVSGSVPQTTMKALGSVPGAWLAALPRPAPICAANEWKGLNNYNVLAMNGKMQFRQEATKTEETAEIGAAGRSINQLEPQRLTIFA